MTGLQIGELAIKAFPGRISRGLAPYWNDAMEFAEINTRVRANMFLAQIGHESQNMTRLEENLNFSAERLAVVWPNRYAIRGANGRVIRPPKPTELAIQIQRNPQEIANHTYGSMQHSANRGYASGDGYRYRGRGLKMVTHRTNYDALTRYFWSTLKVDFLENPDLLKEFDYAIWSAVWFWKTRNLNQFADMGLSGVYDATKIINGGTIGLKERTDLYKKIQLIAA